jgi:hypothetical protein
MSGRRFVVATLQVAQVFLKAIWYQCLTRNAGGWSPTGSGGSVFAARQQGQHRFEQIQRLNRGFFVDVEVGRVRGGSR